MRALLAALVIGLGCVTAFGQVLVSDNFNANDLSKGAAWKEVKAGIKPTASKDDPANFELLSADKNGSIKADLTGTAGDTITLQFGAKTMGTKTGASGMKMVSAYVVGADGAGVGLVVSLGRKDAKAKVDVVTTKDGGADFSKPLKSAEIAEDPENKLHMVKLVINRTSGKCEAFYDGKSVATTELGEKLSVVKDLKSVVITIPSAEVAVVDDIAVFNGTEMPASAPASAGGCAGNTGGPGSSGGPRHELI